MVDIGGIINRLAPLIEQKVRTEYNLLINAKTEARKLSFNLTEVQKVLEEAERRRLTDPRIKTWLERLQDVTYEIDDALDEWETIDHQLEIEDEDDDDDASHTWWEKVSIFIESLCSFSKHVFRRRDMALKIRELNEKVDLIGKETAKYTLLPISADSQDVIKSEITTSYSELFELEGQEREKEEVITLLNGGTQEPGDHMQVISLVGMAGFGKTTIAQLVFRDPGVRSSFELKSWVCVAHISDMASVVKIILQSLRVSYPEYAELQTLLELIESSISGRKFLLVLDHLRIEDDSVLNQLKASLCYGAPGSRIIVTSRNKNIAKLMGSTKIRMVEELSDKDCWLLFSGIAFHGSEKKEREILEGIGQGIARKCCGLPLAAKTLGYYLQSRCSKQLWEDVLEKKVWELDEVAKALFAPLALSYNELPLAVKHCFSYSGILPKGFHINVDELIRLWMVQGYLSSSAAGTDMEAKGRDYFEKLAVCSFFQHVRKDTLEENVKFCEMHGILHDFAQYLMQTGSKVQKQRSFYSVDELSPYKLASLQSVRVLILRCREMEQLPSGIGNLIHLRYLDLSQISIQRLPVTICKLYNLQSLDLRNCTQLSELPKSIHRLRSLRYLLIQGSGLRRLPQGIEKLTGLQTLDEFTVGRGQSKLGYLAKLHQLRGFIRILIRTLGEEGDADDAKKADLVNKIYISELHLMIKGEVRTDVMEALKVPPNLLQFAICGYRGIQFPSWISTSLDKLRELVFVECNQCLNLPPLGALPSLDILHFVRMKSLKCVGCDFLGTSSVTSSGSVAFPKLRQLLFSKCDLWEEWEDIIEDEDQSTLSIMPCLQQLMLRDCKNLKGLPHLLLGKATSLKLLDISNCSLLSQRYKASPDWKFLSPHIQAAMSFH